MSTQKQEEKYCCQHFANLIRDKVVVTKDIVFPNRRLQLKDPHFYDIHPKYVMWVDDMEPFQKYGYHWFHYCSNCGTKLDTDEVIKAWSDYWNKSK